MFNITVIQWNSRSNLQQFESQINIRSDNILMTRYSSDVSIDETKQAIDSSDVVVILYHAPNNQLQDQGELNDAWHQAITSEIRAKNKQTYVVLQNSSAVMQSRGTREDCIFFKTLNDNVTLVMDVDNSMNRLDGTADFYQRKMEASGFTLAFVTIDSFNQLCNRADSVKARRERREQQQALAASRQQPTPTAGISPCRLFATAQQLTNVNRIHKISFIQVYSISSRTTHLVSDLMLSVDEGVPKFGNCIGHDFKIYNRECREGQKQKIQCWFTFSNTERDKAFIPKHNWHIIVHAYEIGENPIETVTKSGDEKLVLAVCGLHKLTSSFHDVSAYGRKINDLLATGIYSAILYLPTEKEANLDSDWKQKLGINETGIEVFDGLDQWKECLWSLVPQPEPAPQIQQVEQQEAPPRRMCTIQ